MQLRNLYLACCYAKSCASMCFRYGSRPVAVKVILPDEASEVSAERKEKFQREVTMLSKMKHPNIVKVFFDIALSEPYSISFFVNFFENVFST